jgi:hypothetical protein
MSRRKRDPNRITEHAHRFAQRNKKKGFKTQSPKEVCATIDEIRGTPRNNGGKWTVPRIAKALNARKIIRGNWNGRGSPRFSNNSTKELYKYYSGTPLSGAWGTGAKKTKQTTLPGLAKRGRSKPGPKAQTTPQARTFVRNNPAFTIMSKTAFKKFVYAELGKNKRGTEIARSLNAQKALRPTYTSGTEEWDTYIVADLFRRLTDGRTLTDVRLGRRKMQSKKTAPKINKTQLAKKLKKRLPAKTKKRHAQQMPWDEPTKTASKKPAKALFASSEVTAVRVDARGIVTFDLLFEGSIGQPDVLKLFLQHRDKLQTD